VSVVVEGLAASAASLIAMAGDTVEAYEVSQLMIHDAWSYVAGNAQEMRELADVLDKVDGQIASVYAGKSGKTAEYFRELMDKDTYLTASEAMEIGLLSGVINTTNATSKSSASARNKRLIDLARVKYA
jgi:ATP-dependent protease ClpP protease subunit